MRKVDIRSKCRVNSNREMDTFVGLRCNDGDISINFPIGYHISGDDNELRKDIILLFTTLSTNTVRKESDILKHGSSFDDVEFPLQSYMYLIKDYFVRGYYKEHEVSYKVAKSGKINWNRTIKTQKPYVQDMDVFYLDFITKKNSVKEDELIQAQIDENNQYESMKKRIKYMYENGNTQFIECLYQFRIYFIHTLWSFFLLRRIGIVRNCLIIDLRNTEMCPSRHFQRQPMAIRFQSELQQPFGFIFFR